jgi:hypothetical protein
MLSYLNNDDCKEFHKSRSTDNCYHPPQFISIKNRNFSLDLSLKSQSQRGRKLSSSKMSSTNITKTQQSRATTAQTSTKKHTEANSRIIVNQNKKVNKPHRRLKPSIIHKKTSLVANPKARCDYCTSSVRFGNANGLQGNLSSGSTMKQLLVKVSPYF